MPAIISGVLQACGLPGIAAPPARSAPSGPLLPAGGLELRSLNHRSLNCRYSDRGNGCNRFMHSRLGRCGRGDGGGRRQGRAWSPYVCGGKVRTRGARWQGAQDQGAQGQDMQATRAQGKKTGFESAQGCGKKSIRGKPPQYGHGDLAGTVFAPCRACGCRYVVEFVPAHIAFRLRPVGSCAFGRITITPVV